MRYVRKRNRNTALELMNVKRCLAGTLVSIAFFSVLLISLLSDSEVVESFRISVTFFSVVSAAFSCLFFLMIRNKTKAYYHMVTQIYLIVVHLFMIFFAQQNILFYYATVVLSAYLVLLPMGEYIALTMGELACFAVVIYRSGTGAVLMSQIIVLSAVHLFAFLLSRDFYAMKKSYLEEERKLHKVIREAEIDPLTGLMNRRGLERHVEKALKNCVSSHEMMAVFVMDIDLFKSYNDCFGHVQGDVCIGRVARSIAETVGNNGVAARIGGEEFLVFLSSIEAHEAYSLAEQIRKNVENMQITRGAANNSVVTISIGVDMKRAASDVTLQGLYGRADRQLYQAKQDGRNCVRGVNIVQKRRTRII